MQDTTIRELLRAKTLVDHERLHRHASFAALVNQSLGLPGYRQLVRRLFGFYAPLDQAIERALTGFAGSDYAYVRRSDILAHDMSDLGFSQREIVRAPRCEAASGIVSPRTVAGVVYVVEGATLGGSRIDRAARSVLRHDVTDGRRYWSWCRSEGAQRWPATLQYLQRMLERGATVPDLQKGAGDTFGLLAEWLAPLDRTVPRREARET